MIASCGEALIDFVPVARGGSRLWAALAGGSPYNVARGLARLGVDAAFVGAISTDSFGDLLVTGLEESGTSTQFVERVDRPSTLSFVHLDGSDAAYEFFGTDSADQRWTASGLDELVESIEAFHFGSISMALEPAASEFERLIEKASADRVISFDPNVRARLIGDRAGYLERFGRLVGHSDIVKLSSDDLAYLDPAARPLDAAKSLLSRGPSLVVVTSGVGATTALTINDVVTRPSVEVPIVDTIGAGDGFTAGFLSHLAASGALSKGAICALESAELERALDAGIRTAALVCVKSGAQMPTLDEIGTVPFS